MRIHPNRKDLIRLYRNDYKTLPAIAKVYGVSYPAIRKWFIKLGIERRSFSDAQLMSHAPDLDKDALRQLYLVDKKSQSEIATMFHLTQSGVKNRMRIFGIKARGKANIGSRNGMFGKTHTAEVKEQSRQRSIKQFSTPESRERQAVKTAKQIADGRTGKTHNKLETRVAKMLATSGIDFIWQYRIGKHVFDFFLPQMNALIEVNGTFWHADPRFYDHSNLKPVQARNVANDIVKADVAKQNGHILEVWWEYDVENAPSKFPDIFTS